MSSARTATSKGVVTRWTVDFWLDPACPRTRHTARWVAQITNDVPLDVRWRVMSLSVLNEHRDDDPEEDRDGFLWIPARVATAVQTEHGHDALGEFYDALWTHPDGTEREWIGDIGEALHRAALPVELAATGTSDAYDTELRASHHDGVSLVDADIGTPVLRITGPDGTQSAFFGPVLDSLPATNEQARLWAAMVFLADVPSFQEVKA